ncbi:MAG: phytoene desaturase family protein [Flavobacteriaceae bacterium]|nr:phytoene desaturase family protein [Flavobacteriaceae bacterium]
MSKNVIIIGSGAGGLSTAILLAKKGFDVTVLEKNSSFGGRGSVFSAQGFQFDMGPSWYLMPDIFEHFYELVGEDIKDHLTLERLDPSYKIWFGEQKEPVSMTSDLKRDSAIFESYEPGVMKKIELYLKEAAAKYNVSKNTFIYKPFDTVFDFIDRTTIFLWTKFSVISSFHKHIAHYVKHPILRKILQYPLVFLGTSPYKAPAVYSLMNHIDFEMGVHYPMGGMTTVFESLFNIAKKNGVKFLFDTPVEKILIKDNRVEGVRAANGQNYQADIVVSNADYHHTEMNLLDRLHRQFSERYWQSRTVAPSGFIIYLGLKKQYDSLVHHNLYFTDKWKESFEAIFDKTELPENPSYYVCAPSKTDPGVAPEGHENLFVLVPTSTDLNLDQQTITTYRNKILSHMRETMDLPDLEQNIVYERIFTGQDFSSMYNAFKGTALGLAQNLTQTALFRPKTKSKKVSNLYYVGANTNPGIGVPMCLISAQIVYKRIHGIKHGRPLSAKDTNFYTA